MQIIEDIEKIQKTQRRISTTSGITMGILMSIYFFTFAALIDRGMFGLLLVEIITTVAFAFAYIFMNTLSFKITRLFYGRNYDHIFRQLKPGDINRTAEEIVSNL